MQNIRTYIQRLRKWNQKNMKECDRLSRNIDNYQSVLFNIPEERRS